LLIEKAQSFEGSLPKGIEKPSGFFLNGAQGVFDLGKCAKTNLFFQGIKILIQHIS